MKRGSCVRCGKDERAEDTFLCSICLIDPKRRGEQLAVEMADLGDYREMRRRLKVDHGWYGWYSPRNTEGI